MRQVVERLVGLGADLHLTDNEGRTALHLGASRARVRVGS